VAAAELLTLSSSDDVVLEAEVARPPDTPTRGVVLCHPHPQYGGTMHSIVIGALFEALPDIGAVTLRFNFRGVEASGGVHDEGRGEREDARAAVRTLAATLPAGAPLVLIGWSFGADMALSVLDPEVTSWVAIAPPLRLIADLDALGRDPRRKLLVLAEHDEVCPPTEAGAIAETWANAGVEVIAGASHFFIGRTDRLTAVVSRFVTAS
jgi:alpha/beta superfamily hydrolase